MNPVRLPNPRMESFCRHWLSGAVCNGAEAARRAGYSASNARHQASRLLRRQDVRRYMDWFRELATAQYCPACHQRLPVPESQLAAGIQANALRKTLPPPQSAKDIEPVPEVPGPAATAVAPSTAPMSPARDLSPARCWGQGWKRKGDHAS